MLASLSAEAEADLIVRARDGDRSAFGEIVQSHYREVVRVVERMCGDAGLAEDAAQEAFLRAWMHLPSFQIRAPFRNWLFRIAINAALDVLRRKTEEPLEEDQGPLLSDPASGPEAALIEKERTAAVREAVASLPESTRSVLVLREFGGMSYREIASTLDIPLGTVMSRLNYARTNLRILLKRYLIQTENAYE